MLRFVLLLPLAGLTACTYARTTMLGPDTALVAVSDSEGSTVAVQRKAMTTAAREGRRRGFDYFGVLASDEGREASTGLDRGQIPTPDDSRAQSVGSATYVSAAAALRVRYYRRGELPPAATGLYSTAVLRPR
ncbi:hypothetical protein HMF7854_13315 [Sphingomonas ginkgonis]|uniref:Uncharacterized protein n=1 Tax=Sphingomonas ginkgonis TaxID=2315330 RepID=A0A3R9YNS4_9SPHN|nr:hypothetical protein [Sphingomonas ginkgonis]RST31707.1 hypothetical protein HMF7854_13315 [Sphingomonas ginkgonis]